MKDPRPAYPDFVILGAPHEDGVVVYASAQLWEASIHVDREPIYYRDGYDLRLVDHGPATVRIETTGGEVVMAYGATYAEAFATLFGKWSPKPDDRPGLPAATPELEA